MVALRQLILWMNVVRRAVDADLRRDRLNCRGTTATAASDRGNTEVAIYGLGRNTHVRGDRLNVHALLLHRVSLRRR